jgi:hypothetical protein
MKRRINNQLDADKLRFIDVISSTCFGHHYAHHQEREVNQQTAYGAQHWSRCVRLAKRQVRRHLLGVKGRESS